MCVCVCVCVCVCLCVRKEGVREGVILGDRGRGAPQRISKAIKAERAIAADHASLVELAALQVRARVSLSAVLQ